MRFPLLFEIFFLRFPQNEYFSGHATGIECGLYFCKIIFSRENKLLFIVMFPLVIDIFSTR